MVAKLRDREKADIVIAVTHLPLDPDRTLDPDSACDLEVGKVPGIDLILGSHEHVSVFRPGLGVASTPIFKADANARTVYIHKIGFDRAAGKIDRIDSYLKAIAADIPDEPGTAAVVRAWHDRAFRAFRAEGLDPDRSIAQLEDPLDGREEKVRSGPTNLTRLIGRAMLHAASNVYASGARPELAVFNSGAIRLDDLLVPGVVTEYDVKRILPYDGQIIYARVRGDAISRLLDRGIADRSRGTGGFLQITGAHLVNEEDGGQYWETDAGLRIQRDGTLYPIVFNDYLLMSAESGFDAPMPATPRPPLRQVGEGQNPVGSMQRAVIAQFLLEFGSP
jgi:5'-nucleotidase